MVSKTELAAHKSNTIEMNVKEGLVPKIENSINENLFSVLQSSEILDFSYDKNIIDNRKAYEIVIQNSLFSAPNKELYKVQFNGWADSIHAGILDNSVMDKRMVLCTKFSLFLDVDEEDGILPFKLDNLSIFDIYVYSAGCADKEILDQRFHNFWEALYTIDGNYLSVRGNNTLPFETFK